jgi:hypothetical protein
MVRKHPLITGNCIPATGPEFQLFLLAKNGFDSASWQGRLHERNQPLLDRGLRSVALSNAHLLCYSGDHLADFNPGILVKDGCNKLGLPLIRNIGLVGGIVQ